VGAVDRFEAVAAREGVNHVQLQRDPRTGIASDMRRGLSAMLAASVVSAVPVAVGTAAVVHAAPVFVVNSTADGADTRIDGVCQTRTAGQCTLRAALAEANAVTSAHVTINFNIGGAGARTIRVASRLPLIDNGSAGITIDGFSQPGSRPNTDPLVDNAVRLVEVVGNGPNGHDGFIFLGSNNVLRGMVVRSFKRAVRMSGGNAMFNRVVGSVVGLQANGSFDPTYARVVGSPCVDINNGANRNRIGMPGNENRNVISGCYEKAVTFYNEFTWQNYVQNNILGLDPTGTKRRQNDFGVDINWTANGNIVGGTAFQERNVISGNINGGVEISHGTGTINNSVVGNLIGTDPSGNRANAQTVTNDVGVRLEGAPNCSTTRTCPLDASRSVVTDNVIVNSQWGGILVDKGTHHSTIARNRIGVTLDGTVIANKSFGIRLSSGAQSMTIGPGNVIAGSTRGVELTPYSVQPAGTVASPTNYNTITRNSIDDATGFGIDFLPFGTVNSPGKADPNVNEGVLPPVLAMQGTSVRATTCRSCTVEVYRASRAAGGHGSGIRFIASAVADAGGTALFAQPAGGWGGTITATTRTVNGSTSEFATNIDAGPGGPDTEPPAPVPEPPAPPGTNPPPGTSPPPPGEPVQQLPPTLSASVFVPATPVRIMDTRDGTGVAAGVRPPGSSTDLRLAVPAGAVAVAVNLTVTESVDAGYVQVFPTGGGTPGQSSNVNVPGPNATIANLVIVPIGANSSVTIFDHAGGHLVADLLGYFVAAERSSAGRLVTLAAPQRTLDTRDPLGVPVENPGDVRNCEDFATWAEANRWFWTYRRHADPAGLDDDGDSIPCETLPGAPGAPVTPPDLFKLADRGTYRLPVLATAAPAGGILPPGASGVIMNLTAVEPSEPGFLQVYDDDSVQGRSSNVNFTSNDISANLVIAPIRADGSVTIFSHTASHVVVDIIGYFTGAGDEAGTEGLFVPFAPSRLIDTRETGGPFPTHSMHEIDLAATASIDRSLTGAMFLNATIVDSADAGYMQIFPAGLSTAGATSNVNVSAPRSTRPNAVITAVNAGRVNVFLHSGGDFILDAAGYFTVAGS
jgi:hypothetical protein